MQSNLDQRPTINLSPALWETFRISKRWLLKAGSTTLHAKWKMLKNGKALAYIHVIKFLALTYSQIRHILQPSDFQVLQQKK